MQKDSHLFTSEGRDAVNGVSVDLVDSMDFSQLYYNPRKQTRSPVKPTPSTEDILARLIEASQSNEIVELCFRGKITPMVGQVRLSKTGVDVFITPLHGVQETIRTKLIYKISKKRIRTAA